MKASDVMTSPAITVSPDAAVADIAALLIDRRISAVPVVDDGGRLVGIVSEGDLLRRGETRTERRRPNWLELLVDRSIQAADFVKAHGRVARDVMTSDVVTVTPETELAEIAGILERRRIKRVPVVQDEAPIGIVSRANLLHGLAAGRGRSAEAHSADDTAIRRAIADLLKDEAWVDTSRINIVVSGGVVHLWGVVRSDDQERALEVAAANVAGVHRVENHLSPDWFVNEAG